MRRIVLILVLVFVSDFAFGCSCGQSLSSYFLKQVKGFDAIVEGTFYEGSRFGPSYLILDKVYKGNFATDTVKIAQGGADCNEAFMEDPGVTLLLGLYKSEYTSSPNHYSAPSCATSVLVVNNGRVNSKTKFYNLQIRRPRIGFLSTEMRKDIFERKVKRRL